ncbi:hypothetical protein PC117_g11174 [Phytophthora cactorum]|uniref:Uncharacterized protein n=1 Tax=Phytophthora cactorum TaxID=29920 RepID=A0A8T1DCJ6_9STRA|nr:hypothetical protein PC117_g11174 [Phytophthora cactorum]
MTPRYVWKTVRSDMAREDSQLLMEDMKVFIIVKSPLVPRSVCALTRPHKMQYQLLRRSSETCKAATPYDACQWLGKELTCQELNRVTITESGNHETFVREPRQPQVTPRLKDYGREMASQGLRPTRIRMNITRSPYTKKTLHQNDDHDEILGQIEQLAYGPEVSDTSPFSFGLYEQVVVDIYDLHFASAKVVYDEQVKIVLEKWSLEEQLTGFRSDFNNIWIESDFSRWQCFHTPSGYATTNNPVEQFNRLIKRDYTLHTKHKIGTLPQLLADCCGDQSVTPRTFKEPLAAVEGQS